ncbi:MAG: NAD-dependent succinate-semialdehyde dehydrogenase [Spirochaetaceae bacterium]
MRSVNPATGETIREYKEQREDEVDRIIADAGRAFRSWSALSIGERSKALGRVASALEESAEEYAYLITTEMGKRFEESRGEIRKCAWLARYVSQQGEAALIPEPIPTEASESYVRFDPLGVILAVMPWNFPFWQLFRAGIPAIMAGNVVLLKHAPNVTGCALAIEELMAEAGLPEGVLQALLVSEERVDEIIRREEIRGVTLTGSDEAGRAVAERAGGEIKKSVLELGGSDPFIVFRDADIEAAVEAAVTSRMINAGQSCIAAKRFLIEQGVYQEFLDRFARRFTSLRVGHPLDLETQVAPLAREDLLDNLHRQVAESRAAGAELCCGGEQYDSQGYYYRPTVLTNVTPQMPVFTEETFGPVAPIMPFRDMEEAVELANMSDYGLGASVWSGDRGQAKEIAARLEAGCVFINDVVASDPRLPFGGVKRSGYGRELGRYGIREFTNIKSVWIS